MSTICKAVAYQQYVDGLFNADPHPGNILLQQRICGGIKIVLVDWGLVSVA